MNIIDNAIAARIVYLIIKPFNEWEAFKEGIIDADGTFLHSGVKSDNWTMLHRLVARLKILLSKLPGGQTKIASALASYLLVKENTDHDMVGKNSSLSFKDYVVERHVERIIWQIIEDGEAPANSINNVAGIKPGDEPPGIPSVQKKIMRRKKNVKPNSSIL